MTTLTSAMIIIVVLISIIIIDSAYWRCAGIEG